MSESMITRAAKAIHDGPLGADDYTFDGPSKNEQECSAWCRDVARAALEAMRPDMPTDNERMMYGSQGFTMPQRLSDAEAVNRWINAALTEAG